MTASRLFLALVIGALALIGATQSFAQPPERVRIGSFAIDATEVTIGQFRAFARATALTTAAEREGGGFEYQAGWTRRPGWTFERPQGEPGADAEPAVHIAWTEADAYCRHAGGRLPTIAEWRSAAYVESREQPTDGFVRARTYAYPVGDDPAGMNTDGRAHVAVATTKRGVNGLYDMGANVWEWIADRRGADALTAGGSWWYGPTQTRTDGAQWKAANFSAVYIGFRCAYDVTGAGAGATDNWAQTILDRSDLAAVFAEAGVSGTFVLYEPETDTLTLVDPDRAAKRMVPASTFKIANTMIALETGVVADENAIIPYGGKPQPFKQWEKDMGVREAITASAVPIYQELARRIGLERYQAWLARLDFGNRQTGTALETFWLDGPLEISAIEQARFLAKLAQGTLDISQRAQRIARDVIRLEHKDDATLYGKTGWQFSITPQRGWWVGWVENGSRIHAFAINIDIASETDGAKRVALGKAMLAKLSVY